MASQKMLLQRLADLERMARIGGDGQAKRRLAVERARFVSELVAAARGGNEGASALLAELRRDLVKQHSDQIGK